MGQKISFQVDVLPGPGDMCRGECKKTLGGVRGTLKYNLEFNADKPAKKKKKKSLYSVGDHIE